MGARIEDAFGVKVPVGVVFRHPTLGGLANYLESAQDPAPIADDSNTDTCHVLPIKADGDLEPFFCIHGGDAGIVFYRDLGTKLRHDRPLFAVEASLPQQ
jgi:hypothetical protein